MRKWKKIASETVYDSEYFRVKKDLVELPDGSKKEWTYWDSRDSAMVICMTKDKRLVMIRQYRYMVDDEVIEFPAGFNESAETFEESARREFEEETGYVCGKIERIGAFYETFGQLNRRIHIYFAEGIELQQGTHAEKDDYEDIEVVLIDFEDAIRMVRENKIVSMGSSLALLLLQEKLAKNEITL
jgi:ADP-ribose pyrophosphatase